MFNKIFIISFLTVFISLNAYGMDNSSSLVTKNNGGYYQDRSSIYARWDQEEMDEVVCGQEERVGVIGCVGLLFSWIAFFDPSVVCLDPNMRLPVQAASCVIAAASSFCIHTAEGATREKLEYLQEGKKK